MFEVSWGELGVLISASLFLIGRQDLPRVSRTVGTQLGRVVGLLQGARARADEFASQNELRQLQNELRSGLRDLDVVKSELAVAISSRGMVGRELGATVSSANRKQPQQQQQLLIPTTTNSLATNAVPPTSNRTAPYPGATHNVPILAPEHQTIAAIAEDEWKRQGMAFQSRAEQGHGVQNFNADTSGSAILAKALQISLIHDQYDRTVQKQEKSIQSKIAQMQQNLETKNK